MSPAWIGIVYLSVGLVGVLASGNLIKVMMGLLMMSWGGVLTVLLLGGNENTASVQTSALMSLFAGLPVFIVGLAMLIRRKLRDKSLDQTMKELRN